MKYEIMIRILFELLSKKCVNAKYLANKYEISSRTVYRYIECIELAGVPIYTVRGNNGGFSIMDTYKLSSTFMTKSEFDKVVSAIKAINDNLLDKELDSALCKIKSVSKKEYSGFDIKSGNLIIDGGPWGDTVGYKTKLLLIRNCIEDLKELLINYHDRNGEITSRTIQPYYIVFKQGIWYTYAYCKLRNEFRFFKIGRIESATILDTSFIRKELTNDNLPFDAWYSSVEAREVVLEIDKKILSDVEEWLGVENIKIEDNKYIANVKLPFDDGLISKIISFGSGIKVISPTELADNVIQKSQDIINNYK